jgi:nickel-dependent lactate racemase
VAGDLSSGPSHWQYLQATKMRRLSSATDHPNRADVNSIERSGGDQFVFANLESLG